MYQFKNQQYITIIKNNMFLQHIKVVASGRCALLKRAEQTKINERIPLAAPPLRRSTRSERPQEYVRNKIIFTVKEWEKN